MILDELVRFSNLYGSDEDLVLAGGGNTSAKKDDILYIKASGTKLATITKDGFVKMDRNKLLSLLDNDYPSDDSAREALFLKDLNDCRNEGEVLRPSVETVLHALFPQTFVLHLHPAIVNGLTCGANGEQRMKELFGKSALWMQPSKPGFLLAKSCRTLLESYLCTEGKPADLLFLANHGVFFAADTVEALSEKLEKTLAVLHGAVKIEPLLTVGLFNAEKARAAFETISACFGEEAIVTFDPTAESIRASSSEQEALLVSKPFTPDQIVYCRKTPLYAPSEKLLAEKIQQYKTENGFLPRIILVKDCGCFAVGKTIKESQTASLLFNDALKIQIYAENFGGAKPQSDELSDFIANWEAEHYRSSKL